MCFGLAEVKCPHTKFHVIPLDACSDPTFFMEKSVKISADLRGTVHTMPRFKDKWASPGRSGVTLLCTLVKVCMLKE